MCNKLFCSLYFRFEIEDTMRKALLPLHAVTGCDTTSSFAGKGKGSVFKGAISSTHLLLLDVGESWSLSDAAIGGARAFVLSMYGSGMTTLDLARYNHYTNYTFDKLSLCVHQPEKTNVIE